MFSFFVTWYCSGEGDYEVLSLWNLFAGKKETKLELRAGTFPAVQAEHSDCSRGACSSPKVKTILIVEACLREILGEGTTSGSKQEAICVDEFKSNEIKFWWKILQDSNYYLLLLLRTLAEENKNDTKDMRFVEKFERKFKIAGK